ncbi:MAG: amylo-alpha-1,6-glucosidase [Gammaproteobacteria bacterium]
MKRPQLIRFGRSVCSDLNQAERREWWLSNGLGGYAAGTLAGTLTRRYHGLLIAPLQPPLGRSLIFAKADACLEADGQTWPLFSNRWPQRHVEPDGFKHIESFRLDGRMPVWQFAFGDLRLEYRIWLEPGANTVYLAYRPSFPAGQTRNLNLTLRLLINARDHHGLAEPWRFNPVVEPEEADVLSVRNPIDSGSAPFRIRFQTCGGRFLTDLTWYRNFDLPVEAERGLDCRDHHLSIGECRLKLANNEWSGLTASIEPQASPYLEEAMRRFFANDEGVWKRAHLTVSGMSDAPDWIRQLVLAADGFLFARPLDDDPEGESVIAGFPWFGDWGRDTMIALPGLTLATGRYDSARRILETFARFIDRGMLPNVFPGAGQTAEYNTVDAALWYIEAWRAYVEATDDIDAVRKIFPTLEEIVNRHRQGARFGIAEDPVDGLLRAGETGVQLTWMDAKVGDWVVTPRIGKPVEINALWYNALATMAQFADRLQLAPEDYRRQAEIVRVGFQRYINPATDSLYDVLDGPEGHDPSLRPNQIFAVSLHYSPLPEAVQRAVVASCGRRLLTSYGLRSLDSEHADYVASYRGGVRERDGAYHQGTVWAWLLGHYALAEYRVTGNAGLSISRLEPVRDHLFDAGLGTVGEIFDADPPHAPRGAPAQAWSVACILEAWRRLRCGFGKTQSIKRGETP